MSRPLVLDATLEKLAGLDALAEAVSTAPPNVRETILRQADRLTQRARVASARNGEAA